MSDKLDKNILNEEQNKKKNLEQLIDDTILNLKIISNLKENDKLITSNNILEIDNQV